jgi:arylsulfatase A-like enzyme/tetratricopeptide (TPR) repeat protein
LRRPLRYTFIVGLVALGTALAAVGGWRYARASAPVSGPIILISVDSLRADRLPPYGYTGVRTPAIDALATDGIVFERAYAHVPQTLPAHASLLTGRLPFRTGVRNNLGFSIRSSELLLPEMLRDRGYETAGVVSSYVLRGDTGISQGFTFFNDELADQSAELATPAERPLERDGMRSVSIAEHWLGSLGTGRAFLFLHLYEPHAPHAAPERFAGLPAYDGEIAYVDEIVGRLVKYLKAHQLYDQSTILLVSDHGEGLGDHGEQGHGLLAYEEAMRVPLIVKRSAGEGAGSRIKDLVQHVDLVPTILDMARAPVPDTLDGRSLMPLLENGNTFPPRMAYGESMFGRYHFGWDEIRTATDGRYWYIEGRRPELYDLLAPPSARINLMTERAGEAAPLASWLDRLTDGSPLDEPARSSVSDRESLSALGYVGLHSTPASAVPQPDLKSRVAIVERYRAAADRASARQWQKAIELFQDLLEDEPEIAEAWGQLGATAFKADRFKLAADAYRRASIEAPADAEFHLGAASALMRLRRMDEAREHAEAAISAAKADPALTAGAHETLARIALAVRDSDEARAQARQAEYADPGLPLPSYVEAYLLYEQGRFSDASMLFLEAVAILAERPGRQIADLRFYTADALMQSGRQAEAEPHLVEELRHFPRNHRARLLLARLYHESGRRALAAETATDIARVGQTAEAYQLAARLLSTFGNSRQAAALRAEAAQTLGKPPTAETRSSRATEHTP